MPPFRHALFALAFASLAVAGCTEDPVFPKRGLVVTATDMPPTGGSAIYELWLSYPPEVAKDKGSGIDHNEPEYFSVGRFTVDASGTLRSTGGEGPAAFAIPTGYNPALVGEALVSVERISDTDDDPDALFMAADITGDADHGEAVLVPASRRTFDSAALQVIQGSFVLEAPTSPSRADQLSGIWFIAHETNQTTGDTISPSTTLRTLPLFHDNDNWVYEAWLVHRTSAGESYRSLGRFRNASTADSNGAGPEAGPDVMRAYRYPGEDFVTSKRQLNDSTLGVVISLQPESIPMTTPLLRLLERTSIGNDAVSGVDLQMVRSSRRPTLEISFDK